GAARDPRALRARERRHVLRRYAGRRRLRHPGVRDDAAQGGDVVRAPRDPRAGRRRRRDRARARRCGDGLRAVVRRRHGELRYRSHARDARARRREGGRRGRPLHRAPRRRAGAVAQGARRGPPRDRSRRARAARRPACARTGGTSRARAARPRRGEERGREGGRRGVCARGLDPPARGRRLATFRDLSQVPGGVVEFFLRRPIFASVCSLVILLLGLISIPILPIAQYPNIAPPTVTVTAVYTGASAEAVEASVTTPVEQAINTVQGLRYISSQSGSDGTSTITCTFNLDRDLDQAANDVQNAVNLAQGNIPNEVKQVGITVSKNSGTFVMAIGVTSTD